MGASTERVGGNNVFEQNVHHFFHVTKRSWYYKRRLGSESYEALKEVRVKSRVSNNALQIVVKSISVGDVFLI